MILKSYHNSVSLEDEPYCAVKEAVTDERISQERYEDYLSFLKETKALKEKKYG